MCGLSLWIGSLSTGECALFSLPELRPSSVDFVPVYCERYMLLRDSVQSLYCLQDAYQNRNWNPCGTAIYARSRMPLQRQAKRHTASGKIVSMSTSAP